MKRARRNRHLQLGIFFLIYSCLYAYSASIGEPTKSSIEETSFDDDLTSMSTRMSTTSDVEEENEFSTQATHYHHSHPTWRPRRDNCTPPALEQFPRPIMGPNIRKHGGLIIHVLVAVFTFFGLAIVCDDYFVSSLDRICEELKLTPDVAGATFMAAGSSAPELATVIIGVFFAKDDIGVSGVIGSAVFNIMFVISVCALCSGTVSQLNYWPLIRDCTFYSISILIMLVVICNEIISWPEALVMMIFYVIYCIALHFNTQLEIWANPYLMRLPIKLPTREEQSALVTFKNVPEGSYTQGNGHPQKVESPDALPPKQAEPDYSDPNSSWDPNNAWDDGASKAPVAAPQASYNAPSNDSWGNDAYSGSQNYGYNNSGMDDGYSNEPAPQQQQQQTAQSGTVSHKAPNDEEYYKPKEPRVDSVNPLEKPTEGGMPAQIAWAIVYPIHYMCRLTMVDVKLEKYKKYYPLTFTISMVWISFYSYFMVWMITIIGSTLGIPDTVMGLTFVAAGVSVPDALSSIAVIKEGYGDMAVSNAVGSNVFDILICLGLPWFIQTAIIVPGSHVNVISKGLTYSTLSLLSTVVFLLFATHMNGWKLDKKLGVVLMFWYLLFISIASLYELNVFGYMNPPECPTLY